MCCARFMLLTLSVFKHLNVWFSQPSVEDGLRAGSYATPWRMDGFARALHALSQNAKRTRGPGAVRERSGSGPDPTHIGLYTAGPEFSARSVRTPQVLSLVPGPTSVRTPQVLSLVPGPTSVRTPQVLSCCGSTSKQQKESRLNCCCVLVSKLHQYFKF